MSKEDYKKARATVNAFETAVNESLVEDRVCCVCQENTIEKMHPVPDATKQEQGMWSGGVVERVNFGYGSIFDMSSFYIAICDDCVPQLIEKGLMTEISMLVNAKRNKLH